MGCPRRNETHGSCQRLNDLDKIHYFMSYDRMTMGCPILGWLRPRLTSQDLIESVTFDGDPRSPPVRSGRGWRLESHHLTGLRQKLGCSMEEAWWILPAHPGFTRPG